MEATVEQKLENLYNLQIIDTKIDKIQNIRGELPIEVSDLEDEIAGLQTRQEKLKSEIDEFKKGIEEAKQQIKTSQGLITKYDDQQTNVKNNREFLALSKELEMQKLEIMAAEKKIKDLNAQIDERKSGMETTKALLEDRKTELGHKKGELDTITGETIKEENELRNLRDNAATQINDNRLMQAYKRLRDNVKNGLAVVTIDRNACAGCFSKIPPQRQLDLRQRKKIIVCENCGRVLVDNDLAENSNITLEETLIAAKA
ncbi:MAG: C4-type zinc ribbon domain-containing protein [Bacteroidota bacterium]|nr:C4-type zinc ribbon domain-containing protein [Bacteroidota bacterium]